jgi:PDZ domain-containing protein
VFARWAFGLAAAGLVALAASAAVPTEYWIIAPGSALDLTRRIVVEGHAPSSDRYYLTDVTVTRASVLARLTVAAVPGARIVRRETVVPQGESTRDYDREMVHSMLESQNVAAVVAERASGLAVADPPERIVVHDVLDGAPASAVLKPGDELVEVEGIRVASPDDVARIVRAMPGGTRIGLVVRRDGRTLHLAALTMASKAGTRFGIHVMREMQITQLPVPVRYSVGNVTGGSGGLMFALEIYGSLRRERLGHGAPVAGTGVLYSDGTVGPIEGTLQKLIAAKRAGARTFLVPRENYNDIADQQGIRIIPVGSFREALAALKS